MENGRLLADTDEIVADTCQTAEAAPARPDPGQVSYPAEAKPQHQQPPGRHQGKVRLVTLDDIDGRTLAARRASSLVAAIEADVGTDLSAAERQLAQRAGVLGAFLEDAEARWISGQPFDLGLYCTGLNAQRRVLETLGIKRQPRNVTPSLEVYSQQMAAAK
jgi:hypothetical protein